MAKNTLWNRFWGARDDDKLLKNAFNEAFYKFIGGNSVYYDNKADNYLNKGFKINPIVYSVISQMCDKTKSVPYYIKNIKDYQKAIKLKALNNATNGNYSIKQLADKFILEAKAYQETEMPFPLERPNPNSTWSDIRSLSKLFLRTTGNVYYFIISPEEGLNAGIPQMLYVLPSHKIKIVLKKDANLLYDENPIDYYMLIDGDQNRKLNSKDVIHIKYPNPFFDLQGSQLYGLSPMAALLKNIESSNDALDNNIKTLKNSGVFGFISAKDPKVPLTSEQATQIKTQMMSMDEAGGRMSKIAGSAFPLEFTKLSLDTSELMPFDYLKYDQKQICNVLGWSDALLNNDDSGRYDKQKEERKRVITDNIHPDLILIDEGLTYGFIRKFRGYENAVLESDITELPEMQDDYKEMVEWMDKAPITENEKRLALKYETLDIDGMDSVWISSSKKRIDEITINESDIEKSYNNGNETII